MDRSETDQLKKKKKITVSEGKYGTVISSYEIRFIRVIQRFIGPEETEEFSVHIPQILPPVRMRRMLGSDIGLNNSIEDIHHVNNTDGSIVELLLKCGIRDYLYYIHIQGKYLFMYRDTSIEAPTYHFLDTVRFNVDEIDTFTF